MKNITALVAAGLLAASSTLVGCSPTTEQAYTGPPVPPPTVWTGSPAPATASEGGHGGGGHSAAAADERPAEGANLASYISSNNISEVPIKKDQPGTPKFEFPLPPDWSPAGARTPDWAYGAIVYNKPVDPNNPPFMYAIASKLTGDVDPAKILALAPGQLNELPEFEGIEGPDRTTLAGYDAVSYTGTYIWEEQPRSVGQETVVIPAKDGIYVLQLNGEAPGGQEKSVQDAADVIRSQTKITLPS